MYLPSFEESGNTLEGIPSLVYKREFRFFKCALRLFGFWQPRNATFLERVLYPIFVNLLIFIILVLNVYCIISRVTRQNATETADFIIEISTSVSRYVWAWLGHALTMRYFKQRNMENGLLNIEIEKSSSNEFRLMVRGLNKIMIISLGNSVLCFALSLVTGEYLHYPSRWLQDSMKMHNRMLNSTNEIKVDQYELYGALTLLTSISDLYVVPIMYCLTSLMYILSRTSRLRLLQLRDEYMKWERKAEDAVFRHYSFYTTNVQSNCEQLKMMFVSQNILMVIITPQLFYLCEEVGKKHGKLDLVIFLYYLLLYFTSWIAPLYYAESLRSEEELFCNEINNFCPKYFALLSEQQDSDDGYYMRAFSSRREVTKLVSYLKGRKSGFLIGGYSFQLQLSMLSFYLGLLTFVVKVMS